jgi:hypothetical protein
MIVTHVNVMKIQHTFRMVLTEVNDLNVGKRSDAN